MKTQVIEDQNATIHYLNATKKGNKIGVMIGRKVVHFMTDEMFEIGDELVVSVRRKAPQTIADVTVAGAEYTLADPA